MPDHEAESSDPIPQSGAESDTPAAAPRYTYDAFGRVLSVIIPLPPSCIQTRIYSRDFQDSGFAAPPVADQ